MKKLSVDLNEETLVTFHSGLFCARPAVSNVRIKILKKMRVMCLSICKFVNIVADRNARRRT